MGDLISKSQKTYSSKYEGKLPAPRFHFKSRYHKDDENCETKVYTRTKDTFRCEVPIEKIKWEVEMPEYKPTDFTSPKILLKDGATYKDPELNDDDYEKIQFNAVDKTYNVDRLSHHGLFEFFTLKLSNGKTRRVPRNPVGRTGLSGRGHLGRWGCNHAADPIVTTWSRDANGKVNIDQNSGKPILKFVGIQRHDTKEWAIPGGMRDAGEVITKTLVREFAEEALDYKLKFNKKNDNQLDAKSGQIENQLDSFFKHGELVYKGYVDDPRNTDNAWMETIACNFHDETGGLIGNLCLKGGDDATHAVWIELNSNLKLFASHYDFIEHVATMHGAHW